MIPTSPSSWQAPEQLSRCTLPQSPLPTHPAPSPPHHPSSPVKEPLLLGIQSRNDDQAALMAVAAISSQQAVNRQHRAYHSYNEWGEGG